jgi:hypothetical protein
MPDNNMMIMVGLGAAALWFMNRGGSQEDQVDQLAGAAMMASGEGTTPDAPFQEYSAPANPVFFFNRGGQMAQVPGTNVPVAASSGEDIGVYPGGQNRPELEFTVARSNPPVGTTDISPTTPEFAGNGAASVTASTVWDQQALIATANVMPLIGIETTDEGLWNPVQSNVDIANLSSKESFRAVNLDSGHAFTTTGEVLAEYVRGFAGSQPAAPTNAVVVSQTATFDASMPAWAGGDNWWDEG